MTGARPVPASVTVDRMTTSAKVVGFAQFEKQLNGTEPYVRIVRVDVPCAPAELLPEGAEIERCVTTDSAVVVLARVGDTSIHIESRPRTTTIQVASPTHERAEAVTRLMRAHVPESPTGTINVRVWHQVSGKPPGSADRSIEAPRWDDIAANYPPMARSSLETLVALSRPVRSGKLVLWHGPPGTGKTTALRALMRAWQPWCQAQYISDPERFFAEPSYMSEVLTTAPVSGVGPSLHRAGQPEAVWRLVIAEDSDEYLRSSARRDAGAALGRLLNLCDGILGQGMNIVVLLTTNEETSRLHPAIVRPGRCLAAVPFPAFDGAQASAWLGRRVERPMTLAELLEARGDLKQTGAPAADAVARVGQYL